MNKPLLRKKNDEVIYAFSEEDGRTMVHLLIGGVGSRTKVIDDMKNHTRPNTEVILGLGLIDYLFPKEITDFLRNRKAILHFAEDIFNCKFSYFVKTDTTVPLDMVNAWRMYYKSIIKQAGDNYDVPILIEKFINEFYAHDRSYWMHILYNYKNFKKR